MSPWKSASHGESAKSTKTDDDLEESSTAGLQIVENCTPPILTGFALIPYLSSEEDRIPIKNHVQHQVAQPPRPEPEQQLPRVKPLNPLHETLLLLSLLRNPAIGRQDDPTLPGPPRGDVYSDDEVGLGAVIPGGVPSVGKAVWGQELVSPDRILGEGTADARAEETGRVEAREFKV
jgi:hypothetical protein